MESDHTSDDEEQQNVGDDEEMSGSEESEEELPVLSSIVKHGKVPVDSDTPRSEDAEKLAIRQELSGLSFEELQKLKEKIGSKKFNQTLSKGPKKAVVKDFKRANPNRPREMSSKSRKVEIKPAVQVAKVFRNDPRFDNLCGEFHERVINFCITDVTCWH